MSDVLAKNVSQVSAYRWMRGRRFPRSRRQTLQYHIGMIAAKPVVRTLHDRLEKVKAAVLRRQVTGG
jgi:hypothetical protein